MAETIEMAVALLQTDYRLQVASYVSLADKRDAVASLIDSSLPESVQEQISDASVQVVFADLVRTGLIEIDVEWTEPPPPVIPEPPPEPEPSPPVDPRDIWLVPPPPPPFNLEEIWPAPPPPTPVPESSESEDEDPPDPQPTP